MHITFIKPKIGNLANAPYIDEGRMEPLMIGVLAGLTPPDVEIAFYDDRFENIPYDKPTDLVAITVEAFNARHAYEIAAEYKQRGVPVIVGGMHPSLFPQEAARYVDSVFTGEAETLWKEVVADARHHRLKPLYQGPVNLCQQGVLPRRDIFKGKGYLPLTLMQFSRGCPFHCNFCATSTFFGANHSCRPIKDVIREIEAQDNRTIFFVDDNITANREQAKEFFRALIPLKILWVSQSSVDITEDKELVTLMAKSGCLGFVAGFESITLGSLKAMNKKQNAKNFDQYHHQIKILHDLGFQIWAAFTLGHDGDTKSSLEDTVAFALKHQFTFAAYNILLPYPNTPLYRKLDSENRLLYDKRWWLHKDYRFNYAAFIPKNMTPDELTQSGMQARKKFNSFPAVLRRVFNFKTNMRSLLRLGIYIKYNRLFKKEVVKKEGMNLGVTKRDLLKEEAEQGFSG